MKAHKIFLFALIVLLSACSSEDDTLVLESPLQVKGIRASISDELSMTRAVAKLGDVVGRNAFVATDRIVFTNIQRAENPLKAFTYSNIIYDYDGKKIREYQVNNCILSAYVSNNVVRSLELNLSDQ